jgi:hypothetical protein
MKKLIEDSVRRRLFDRTVEAINDRNAVTDPDTLMGLIDSIVRDVRRARSKRRGTTVAAQ